MICPKCGHQQHEKHLECERCGVIFAKIPATVAMELPQNGNREELPTPPQREHLSLLSRMNTLLLHVKPAESMLTLTGRSLIYLLLLGWGLRLMTSSIDSNYVGESFLHLVNLPFHEAGHVLFAPFGRFVQVLGGTLCQLLVPGVIMAAFLVKENPFGAAVGLWWLGENLLDCAPYMADARAGQLMLLGGVTGSEVEDYHDWEIILGKLGWLHHDQLIARIAFGTGTLFMILALTWAGHLLWRQYRTFRRT